MKRASPRTEVEKKRIVMYLLYRAAAAGAPYERIQGRSE